jgi:hypothetical protein
MSNLVHFLLIFDRLSGNLIKNIRFSDSDLAADQLSIEEHKYSDNENIEVLLISSDSEETLKKTHGHYFSGASEELDYSELLEA